MKSLTLSRLANISNTYESRAMRAKPIAIFMAFGTKGDVYPIAAIAAAFACDQENYQVFFVTHSAHEDLRVHFEARRVAYLPVSSPPVVSPYEDNCAADSRMVSFSHQKRQITAEHREACVSIFEEIFGDDPSTDGDLIVINFFALEGWSLAELYHVRCVVAAPYVVPYSAPTAFEQQFRKELPLLYKYLEEAPVDRVSWKDVIHWMWPLFTEEWGSWRSLNLKLTPLPFTDPVTGLPTWHDRPSSPLLLYGFSKEVIECPGYWPSNVRVCGFWFLPAEWQFSCKKCAEISSFLSSRCLNVKDKLCSGHSSLQSFLSNSAPEPPVFIGLSSVGSMGFLRNSRAFLKVLECALKLSSHRFILFSAGYEPLDAAIEMFTREVSSHSEEVLSAKEGISLFDGRLFCFSGTIPYNWLFPRCSAAIHHGGSGSTAAALHAGIPQVICPFILDQFYWAERMSWIGVAPEPLQRNHLLPEDEDDLCIKEAAIVLARAINFALSPKVKAIAFEIAKKISVEGGVMEALRILKEEIIC